MIIVDARRDRTQQPWRRWRRRLHGAVERALRSPTPATTWRAELPALAAAGEQAMRATLDQKLLEHGRDPEAAWVQRHRAVRAEAEVIVAATMGPARAAKLLAAAGIDLDRAMRLVELVGPAVADAVAFLDVLDVLQLDGRVRGAA